MKTIAINGNNDIYLTSSGSLAVKKDLEAMADILTNKVQTNKGELIYDTEKGIDFMNTIFNSPSEPELFQAELIKQLEDTDGVKNVYSYSSSVANNVYSYTADNITDYGNITLNG